MLAIAGTVTVDPKLRDNAVPAAIKMMEETRKEQGNITYAFSFDLEDPAVIRVFEHWESEEALSLHFKMPHMAEFQKAIGEVGVTGMDVKKFQISSVGLLG